MPLSVNRLKIFKDQELKEQFQDINELNLRIVTINLEKQNKKQEKQKSKSKHYLQIYLTN